MKALREQALALQDELTALRRAFHMYPETGMRERRTARRIEEELDALGVEHRRIAETGVWATIRGSGARGGAVVLRADIDALPITERGGAPYRSRNEGVMHACGHDAHTACLLGAARLLARRRESFDGEVRLVFQNAEECGDTPREFIAAGLLDGVTRAYGLHCAPDLPCGVVGIKPGPNNAGVDRFTVSVRGRSAHIATPQRGVDALYIAAQLVVNLQALVTRRGDPAEPTLIGVGRLTAGTTYNAVAETALLEGTTRTMTRETRARLRADIERMAKMTAESLGGTAEVEWESLAPPLVNDVSVSDALRELAERYWPEKRFVADRALSLMGDDFSEFIETVPGVYAYLGTADPARPETARALHSADFDIDERALPLGAWLYAAAALNTLGG